ncbi:unnamed protein product [Rotaria sordida]|uniref:Uncharacterized protein n=1 Tax=Rotaria sordida TaxID=392033 RepID=A0A814D2Y9_9BILA|nr:unnamed protein product [Rotaria sordida]CAF0948114.1 unnamed protein product [Rotaria sordida]
MKEKKTLKLITNSLPASNPAANLSYKLYREDRAFYICHLRNSIVLKLAIKYATESRQSTLQLLIVLLNQHHQYLKK